MLGQAVRPGPGAHPRSHGRGVRGAHIRAHGGRAHCRHGVQVEGRPVGEPEQGTTRLICNYIMQVNL